MKSNQNDQKIYNICTTEKKQNNKYNVLSPTRNKFDPNNNE